MGAPQPRHQPAAKHDARTSAVRAVCPAAPGKQRLLPSATERTGLAGETPSRRTGAVGPEGTVSAGPGERRLAGQTNLTILTSVGRAAKAAPDRCLGDGKSADRPGPGDRRTGPQPRPRRSDAPISHRRLRASDGPWPTPALPGLAEVASARGARPLLNCRGVDFATRGMVRDVREALAPRVGQSGNARSVSSHLSFVV